MVKLAIKHLTASQYYQDRVLSFAEEHQIMSDFGDINNYVKGAALKRLTSVETSPAKSNQHELQGISSFRDLFGRGGSKLVLDATFVRLNDEFDRAEAGQGTVTWYDARAAKPRPAEYKLYYSAPCVAIEYAEEGDIGVVVLKEDDSVVFVTAERDSAAERALVHLFGPVDGAWSAASTGNLKTAATFDKRPILEMLGILPTLVSSTSYLDAISDEFGELCFPSTAEFSRLACSLSPSIEDFASADEALVTYYEVETAMFYQLEDSLILPKIQAGYPSSDEFFKDAKSWTNRRRTRAGAGLENHLEAIFVSRNLTYTRGPHTEGKKKPDFIFPSIACYHDLSFDSTQLRMVASKTSAKDRWRQILSEAERIARKHLFTLQSPITESQTSEMSAANVQLVVPKQSHQLFTNNQKRNLWDLETLLEALKS